MSKTSFFRFHRPRIAAIVITACCALSYSAHLAESQRRQRVNGADAQSANTTYHWAANANGSWTTSTSWCFGAPPCADPGSFPNAVGDVALFDFNITNNRSATFPDGSTVTVGTITLADDNRSWFICPQPTTGQLVFDVSSGSAALNLTGNAGHSQSDSISCVTTLNDPLIIDIGSDQFFTYSGGIGQSGGAMGITKNGAGILRFMPPTVGTNTYTGTTTVSNGTLMVNTNLSQSAFALSGGTIAGGSVNNGASNGTVGALTTTGGTIAPGSNTGGPPQIDILNVAGNLTLNASTTYAVELAGTTAGAFNGYDQLNVTSNGSINLAGATLSVTLDPGFTPTLGNTFTIINNDGAAGDPIVGRFAGLPLSGNTFTAGGKTFAINYAGGDGNDVVLTVVTAPTAAMVTVSGRVVDANNTPIRNARVTLTMNGGESITTLSNAFGYYRFDDVESGQACVLSAGARGYIITPRVIGVNDTIAGLEIKALP